jgi:adenosylcobinamide-GDP ribazoletransferase
LRFIAAWRFLTVIPLPGRKTVTEDIGRSLVYFPVVGIIIGIILAFIAWAMSLLLPQAVFGVLVVIAMVLVTGALHLDGLADTCDGLGGSTVEERQQIMRDSHTGSFGITGMFCILVLKVVSLITIPRGWLLPALIAFPVIGRWAMVYALTVFPYARPSGLGKAFKERADWLSFTVATIITVLMVALLLRFAGIIILLLVWGVVTGIAAFCKRKFAGLTGDNYGAICEITETLVLVLIVVLINKHWLGL